MDQKITDNDVKEVADDFKKKSEPYTDNLPDNLHDNLPDKKDKAQIEVIRDSLEDKKFKVELTKALGKGKDIDKYIRGVLTTVITGGEKLKSCTHKSIMRSILTSAQLGIEVDAKEHGYLVPYWNKDVKRFEAKFMPGYKGYLYKAWKSNQVKAIYVEPVHDGDNFKVVKGLNPNIIHEPDIKSVNFGDDIKITFFYAIVKLTNGEFEFEVMTRKQVDEIMRKAKTDMIWKSSYQEMGRKTVFRRLAKKLQLPELDRIIEHEKELDKVEYNGKDKDPEHIDRTVSDYKRLLIICIEDLFDKLELKDKSFNLAKKRQVMLKYLKVNDMGIATVQNLELLKEKILLKLEGMRKEKRK